MSKTARIYRLNVHLDGYHKRLLEKLVKRRKLKKNDVVRLLIRAASEELQDIKQVANG